MDALGGTDAKRHAPATARNREAIAAVLAGELPDSGRVLEIASGTGEHAVYFAERFPGLTWQPSDPDAQARASIAAHAAEYGGTNLCAPLAIDAAEGDWLAGEGEGAARYDACLCINMVHISAWEATLGLFRGCAKILTGDGAIILYGPFFEDGVNPAPSNCDFDRSLRERNPDWGLRNVGDVDRVACEYRYERTGRYQMPANNLMLVYRKPS